ncbi:hypothetical protein FIBSPDRAFT_521046 [Athelia psychrophila]|uniref:Uncharacterized protein n=1 Tax=Athelia psychrophila TaxID=1759441 RepID=A0A166JTQ1_9AGAM|nr:hypothetical protein FIBSPDRAFT_521046 [Fibularhizoctonia sp. CBS 109695]
MSRFATGSRFKRIQLYISLLQHANPPILNVAAESSAGLRSHGRMFLSTSARIRSRAHRSIWQHYCDNVDIRRQQKTRSISMHFAESKLPYALVATLATLAFRKFRRAYHASITARLVGYNQNPTAVRGFRTAGLPFKLLWPTAVHDRYQAARPKFPAARRRGSRGAPMPRSWNFATTGHTTQRRHYLWQSSTFFGARDRGGDHHQV